MRLAIAVRDSARECCERSATGRGDLSLNERESDARAAIVAHSGVALRAWSLAVSFLGDCIVPRGGDVGMATITEVLAAFGVDPGVTRTSMSRLAGDGWVTRQKVGRNSFYSLTPVALANSEIRCAPYLRRPVFRRILARGASISAAACPKPEQARLRASLRRSGAADLGAHVYLLPAGDDRPDPGPRDRAEGRPAAGCGGAAPRRARFRPRCARRGVRALRRSLRPLARQPRGRAEARWARRARRARLRHPLLPADRPSRPS